MSNKTKRLAKGLGASALAVATIATGLSFGPSAALADEDADTAHKTYAKFAIATSERWFSIQNLSGAEYMIPALDESDALTKALAVSVPGARWGEMHIENSDKCIGVTTFSSGGYIGVVQDCDGSEVQMFQLDDGKLTPKVAPDHYLTNLTAGATPAALWFRGSGTPVTIGPGFSAFNGSVTSTNFTERSAVVTGSGEPGANVVLQWGDGEYEDATRVNDDGVWDFELDNLKLGSNPVKLLQYENQQLTGEYELDVELKVAELTVQHEFGDAAEDLVTLSGSAQAGAIVQVFNEDDQMVVASEPANEVTGAWSVELPAPNKGGSYDLNVYQSLQGERTSKTPLSIDYGKQLVIDRPESGFAHPGGQLDVRGTGESDAVVEVHEGDRRVGGPVTVRPTGNWSLKTIELNASEHKLTVTQKSKGGNVQAETIVVNAGEDTVELTAAGRFNAADSTKPAEAFGSAPTGSTVVLRNSVGTEIGRAVAKGDAYVIPIDPAKATSGVNTFSVVMEGAPESDAKSFTLNYGQPAAAVVVTKPAENGTVEPGRIAFAGTGATGSKIVVRGSIREVASGTVTAGAWSATSTVDLQKGSYDLYFDQIAKGGLTSTVRHAFTIGETAPIVTPHTVTSPAAGAVVDTLTPEFRGTGHEGATITVRGSSRVVATGTVQNGQWAAKTDPDAPLTPGTYNLYVVQSVRGTVTGTIRVAFTVSNEAFRELSLSAPAQGETVTVLRPTFVGTATPGAEITVASSRRTVATATVDEFGTFRATALFDLERGGSYPGLEVKQVTKTGKSSTTAAFFTVDRNAQ
ncbi:hypothetical protein ABC270_03935 [Curtobacterium sp. 1P10AnD]|uniref:hypothetical protein n=1 Tax=Curtobacterium sp. 1P10AnD TaxID=3132283 RepID=UPI0039A2180A